MNLKAGRFLSGVGYLNGQHSHTWDFVDAPLAYQAFLGGQYKQDGVQARWLAPLDTFLEVGAELGSGRSFPGNDRNKNGVNAASVFAHAGDDIGDAASWRAGLSYLRTGSRATATTNSTASRTPSAATARCGWRTRSTNGRRTAIRPRPISSCRASTCGARKAAPWPRATWPRRLRVDPVRLVPAGRLPVHAELARGPALRPAVVRHADHRPGRQRHARHGRLPGAGRLQPEALERDAGLEPVASSRACACSSRATRRVRARPTTRSILQYIMSLGAHAGHTF